MMNVWLPPSRWCLKERLARMGPGGMQSSSLFARAGDIPLRPVHKMVASWRCWLKVAACEACPQLEAWSRWMRWDYEMRSMRSTLRQPAR